MTGPIFPPMTERPEEVWVDRTYDPTTPRCCDPRAKICSAVQYSDLMVCEPCKLRWDTNDSDRPACTRLPTVYDGVPHNWPGIKDGSKSYPFFAIARKHGVSYAVVLSVAEAIKNGYGLFDEPMSQDIYMEIAAICRELGG